MSKSPPPRVVMAALTATGILASHATAQVGLESLAAMHGACTRLSGPGRDFSGLCGPTLINETFRSGRTGFTFLGGESAEFAFSGMGPRQVKLTPDKVFQPIDSLILTLNGPPPQSNRLPATGGCTYSNPYAGRSHVSCVAHTARGDFRAAFVSDGREPTIKRF